MALRIRHLPAAKYRTVPWRNGGGVTAEIAVEPEGATVDSRFLWRLSRSPASTAPVPSPPSTATTARSR